MSYATGTTHYNLPQTVGTDKRDWFDTNQAFADVDSALYGVTQQSTTDHGDIAAIKATVALLEAADVQFQHDLGETNGRVITLEQNATTDEAAIDDLADMFCPLEVTTAQSDIEVANGRMFRYNGVLYEATADIHIGDTIVPNTNCTATNMEEELGKINTSLADKTFSYTSRLDNTVLASETDKTFSDLNVSNDRLYKLIINVSGTEVTIILVGTTSTYLTIGNSNTTYYACISVTLNTTAKTLRVYNKVLGSGWTSEDMTVKLYELK